MRCRVAGKRHRWELVGDQDDEDDQQVDQEKALKSLTRLYLPSGSCDIQEGAAEKSARAV